MELVKTYDGKITERKGISMDEIKNLDNSALIYVPKDEVCKFPLLDKHQQKDSYAVGQNVNGVYGVHSIRFLRELEDENKMRLVILEAEKENKEKVKTFCAEAKKRKVKFADMHACIAKIINGQRMNEKEMKASDFLGEPETFWNPLKHGMDYNFFKNNYEEIRREME